MGKKIDAEDILAEISWSLHSDDSLSLIDRKLSKLSDKQLNAFAERIDELDLKEHLKARLLTLIFGALGVARFMTGHKVAGRIRLSLPILWVIVFISGFLIPKTDIGFIIFLAKIGILWCLKVAIIALWIWDFIRVNALVEGYNFYQIMDLIQEIEGEDD